MAPVPLRGRRNEPSFITHTLARAAELREAAPDRLAEQLYANALRIFDLEG